jgi:hypothetical protein
VAVHPDLVSTQRPSKHLIGVSFGQIAIEQLLSLGSIHSPLPHFNGVSGGHP